eukprot:58219-Prorocentrum_lima.AAC.1
MLSNTEVCEVIDGDNIIPVRCKFDIDKSNLFTAGFPAELRGCKIGGGHAVPNDIGCQSGCDV